MRIDLTAPTSWSEMTCEQLLSIASLLCGGLLDKEFLIAAFCTLCGVQLEIKHEDDKGEDTYLLRRGEQVTPISVFAVADFSSRFNWIVDNEPYDAPCPFGVDRHLAETTFGNYFHADAMMTRYTQTQNVEYLTKAMSDLGDPRTKLTEAEAMALCIWWKGFKNWLRDQYPHVFVGPGGDAETSPLKIRQNIMLMLNDNRPQENERIEDSNMHDVLAALHSKIEQAKETEKKPKSIG